MLKIVKNLDDLFINDKVKVEEQNKDGETIVKTFIRDGEKEQFELKEIENKDTGEMHELTSIPGFSQYMADLQRGKIYSLVSDKFLSKGKPNYYGYCYSTLRDDDGVATPISLHTLILSAALQQTSKEWQLEGLECDHKNGIKHDNRISNLRLVTRKEQYTKSVRERMGHGIPLVKEQVQYIRYFAAIVKAKGKQVDSKLIHMLADKYDKKYETIRKVVNGVTYSEIELNEAMRKEVCKIELEHDLARLAEIA